MQLIYHPPRLSKANLECWQGIEENAVDRVGAARSQGARDVESKGRLSLMPAAQHTDFPLATSRVMFL